MEGSGRNSISGFALPSAFFPGYLNVFFFADYGAEYSVIATDYTSFSIVYGCTQFGPFKSELSWVLTRAQIEESSAAYTSMMNTVDPIYASKLPDYPKQDRMRTTQHGTGCTYYTQ